MSGTNFFLQYQDKMKFINSEANDSELTIKTAERAVNSFTKCINKSIARGEKVSLLGFGNFFVTKKNARMEKNPKTGEELKIQAKRYPRFKPGTDMKVAAGS